MYLQFLIFFPPPSMHACTKENNLIYLIWLRKFLGRLITFNRKLKISQISPHITVDCQYIQVVKISA